ncbi:MAG: Hsp20/alpha crystallin family protein [Chitinophagaceae bacterium]|nr:Hsp20/alpha crystallin family protein [Chitinophagaceae bacterium]
MTLVKTTNPFAKSFDGLMNELFNEFPATLGKTMREDVFHFPPVNIVDKANAFAIQLSVPGFDKTDFNVKLDANILTISAEKKDEQVSETDKTIRKEFSLKSFKRSFTVDEKIDAANIAAKYENGILLVELPKKKKQKLLQKNNYSIKF